MSLRLSLTALLCLNAAPLMAQSTHEHGVAHLDMVLEEQTLLAEFRFAAKDVLGRVARSEEAKREVQPILQRLREADHLLALPSAAACQLQAAESQLSDADGHDEHDHDEKHTDKDGHDHDEKHTDKDEHDHDEKHTDKDGHDHDEKHADKDGHDHDEKHADKDGHDHDEKHADKDEHDHDEKHADKDGHDEADAGHQDVRVSLTYQCAQPAALKNLSLNVFKDYAMETVRLQAVAGANHQAIPVRASNNQFSLVP